MAQSNAGQGIDKWLASLGSPKRTSGGGGPASSRGGYREWSPQNQRDLDFKNAVNDFVDMLARHGDVKARPDLEHSVEELAANAVGTGKIKAPAVRGPMQRYIPGVAGTGQPGEGKGPEGGAGDTIKRLIAHLEDRLKGHETRDPKDYGADNPSPEDLRWYDRETRDQKLKQVGTEQRNRGSKSLRPINKGLF